MEKYIKYLCFATLRDDLQRDNGNDDGDNKIVQCSNINGNYSESQAKLPCCGNFVVEANISQLAARKIYIAQVNCTSLKRKLKRF